MNMYFISYYIKNKNLYTFKIVHADDVQQAIKKARIKNIVDIKEITGRAQQ